MRKLIVMIMFVLLLTVGLFTLTGCTLTLESTDNSVSASVDEQTQESVGGVIDWIVENCLNLRHILLFFLLDIPLFVKPIINETDKCFRNRDCRCCNI